MRTQTAALVAELIAALRWAPAKSKAQIVEATGGGCKFVENWVGEFHASGLLYVHHTERLHKVGQSTYFFAWQPQEPFGLPDNLSNEA